MFVHTGHARTGGLVSNFVFIPGAGGDPWYWHRVISVLEASGHSATAVELPGSDESAGLDEYARLVVEAIGHRDDVVLVAQSLGGFTAPLAAKEVSLHGLVLVNAMIPSPGETPGAWWTNTGSVDARLAAAERAGYSTELDPAVYFLHDVPAEVLATGGGARPEADVVFGSVCRFDSWPRVPTRVVAGADDRLFPLDFQRNLARDRLGLPVDVLPGGHLLALVRPAALASLLLEI
jgi:pimeloyl-ACP methyl ester carboxylesterase